MSLGRSTNDDDNDDETGRENRFVPLTRVMTPPSVSRQVSCPSSTSKRKIGTKASLIIMITVCSAFSNVDPKASE